MKNFSQDSQRPWDPNQTPPEYNPLSLVFLSETENISLSECKTWKDNYADRAESALCTCLFYVFQKDWRYLVAIACTGTPVWKCSVESGGSMDSLLGRFFSSFWGTQSNIIQATEPDNVTLLEMSNQWECLDMTGNHLPSCSHGR
jgi:hypothetical protein